LTLISIDVTISNNNPSNYIGIIRLSPPDSRRHNSLGEGVVSFLIEEETEEAGYGEATGMGASVDRSDYGELEGH
jgi:hypothetical protein